MGHKTREKNEVLARQKAAAEAEARKHLLLKMDVGRNVRDADWSKR